MNEPIREQVLQRVLGRGAVGIARNEVSGAFYVNIEIVESTHEVFAAITFNPEYVALENDNETDVYLAWGRWEDVSNEVSRFIEEIEFHPCPPEIEDRVRVYCSAKNARTLFRPTLATRGIDLKGRRSAPDSSDRS
jgi:hypothetical protein